MTGRGDRGSHRSVARKLMLSVALFAVAALAVGVGAYALFTGTQAVSQSVGSGTVSLAPVNVSATNNRLSVAAANIAAGDTIERTADAKNTGTISLASVTLTTAASTSSLLDTDTTNGLQMVIDRCSVAWTESAFPYTYTCSGTQTSVLASRQVIGNGLALSNLTLTANTDNFLRVRLTLPSTAGNTFQNLSSVITYSFTATQRNAQPA